MKCERERGRLSYYCTWYLERRRKCSYKVLILRAAAAAASLLRFLLLSANAPL